MKGGGTWKATLPLGQTFFKKLTPITRLIETSLVCVGIWLISTYLISCIFNRLLVPSSTVF
jgi:hypothetical protein